MSSLLLLFRKTSASRSLGAGGGSGSMLPPVLPSPDSSANFLSMEFWQFPLENRSMALGWQYGTGGIYGPCNHNFLINHRIISAPGWTANNATIDPNPQTDPFGGTEGRALLYDASVDSEKYIEQTILVENGAPHTFSVYITQSPGLGDGLIQAVVLEAVGGSTTHRAWIDHRDGDIEVKATTSDATGAVVDLGNGWLRASMSFAAPDPSLRLRIYPNVHHSDGVETSNTGLSSLLFGPTLTESSAAMPWHASIDGLSATVAPRYLYQPDGVVQGLLLEHASENLLLHSTDFRNGWFIDGLTLIDGTAYSGSVRGVRQSVSETAGLVNHRLQANDTVALTSGHNYIFKVRVRAGTRDWFRIQIARVRSTHRQFFNLSTSAVGVGSQVLQARQLRI